MNDAAVRLFAYNLERTFTKQLGASAMRSLRATQQLTPAIAVAGGCVALSLAGWLATR